MLALHIRHRHSNQGLDFMGKIISIFLHQNILPKVTHFLAWKCYFRLVSTILWYIMQVKFFYFSKMKKICLIFFWWFKASSFSQSELTAVQIYNGTPWLISNTQSNIDDCSIFLKPTPDDSPKQFNDFKWYELKTFRQNSYAFVEAENSIQTRNSSECVNQVITDVNSVYIGGIPLFQYRIANSKPADSPYKEIQKNSFVGCLKNVSTILEISNSNNSAQSTDVLFDFKDADLSQGEPRQSNVQYGCSLMLGVDSFSCNVCWYIFHCTHVLWPNQQGRRSQFHLLTSLSCRWSWSISIGARWFFSCMRWSNHFFF